MRYAIISSGGKQYIAREGETLEVDRLPLQIGDPVKWEEVLLLAEDEDVSIGEPFITGASVKGKVVEQIKASKIQVFKYIPKERYRKRRGHRQQYTRVMIDKISHSQPKKKVVEAEKVAEPEAKKKVEPEVKKKAEPEAKKKVAPVSKKKAESEVKKKTSSQTRKASKGTSKAKAKE